MKSEKNKIREYLEQRKAMKSIAKKNCLNDYQLDILLYIGLNGSVNSVNEMNEKIGGSISNTSQNISYLFREKGLVDKVIGSSNQRQRKIILTNEGIRFYNKLTEHLK